MRSRYTSVLWRLVLLILLVSGGTLAFVYQYWELGALAVLLMFVVVWSTLQWMFQMHSKVHLFFEGVKYEDGSLRFSTDQNDPHLNELYQKLNEMNEVITDIRIREANSERFFKEFMKRSASGLIAVDDEQFVEIVNDTALQIIGLPNLTHMRRLEQHQPTLFALMQNLKPDQSEHLKILDGNQLKLVAVKVAQIRFSDKTYRIFSLYDIKTEVEAHELDTWQKLMRIMAHEIMNSIAPITSLSQTLSGYFIQNDTPVQLAQLQQTDIDNTVKGLQVIGERASGLRGFVDNYRKLTKIPEPEFGVIHLQNWLDSVVLLFRGQAEDLEIELNVSNQYPQEVFHGDERLLTHVVLNLLQNAVQALENSSDKKIEVIAEQGVNGALKLRVIDNGKGFLPEEQDKIFLPFYTSKENGSGIGLSLSKQIMRKHKGSISASSESGRTEFVLEV
ncbi:HAMP domain-containing histidine kinase [bacterium SCSIO 12643]|nr:HAMP domain-containing histidine kinase [bacterium SCSIO 12643]